MTWRMWAHLTDRGEYLHLWPNISSVEDYGMPFPIVQVDAEEVPQDDESGTHWGWLPKELLTGEWKDTPRMIWPRLHQLEVCFPYSLEVAEEHGRGRRVRLRVTLAQGEAS